MSFANQSGIYAITNAKSGGMYVGSAVNFKRRWRKHLSDLRRGGHHSQILQNAWNKHGADAFVFDVIEFVDPLRLIEREQVWLNFFKPRYNVAKTAGAAMAGQTHTPEARLKISAAISGSTRSPETRARISAAAKRRAVTPEQVSGLKSVRYSRLGQKNTPEHRARISAAIVEHWKTRRAREVTQVSYE